MRARIAPFVLNQFDALIRGDWSVLDAAPVERVVQELVEDWGEYYLERPIRSLQLDRFMSMAFENVDYTSLDIPAAPFSDPARIPDFPKNKVPRHIGVIMDGNGRWAKQRGMVRTNGHQAAEPVVFDTTAGAIEAGVRY